MVVLRSIVVFAVVILILAIIGLFLKVVAIGLSIITIGLLIIAILAIIGFISNIKDSKKITHPEPYRSLLEVRSTNQYSKTTRNLMKLQSSFIKDALKYVDQVGELCEFVPFTKDQPTYASMNNAQKRHYFYWRTQLRSGVFLSADTGYLFLYVYEIINLIGFSNAYDAFDHLIRFWETYRVLCPELDLYLPDWIADFMIVHDLSDNPFDWYRYFSEMGCPVDEDLVIESLLQSKSYSDDFSLDLIFQLADYNPTTSRFYRKYVNTFNLDEAYEKCIKVIDDYLQAKKDKSLFDIYKPFQVRVIKRQPFEGAIHNYKSNEIHIATVHNWRANKALKTALSSILKYTDNLMRLKRDIQHKPPIVAIDPEWKVALDLAFSGRSQSIGKRLFEKNRLKPQPKAARATTPLNPNQRRNSLRSKIKKYPKRELDNILSTVEKVNKESEALRQKLASERPKKTEEQPKPTTHLERRNSLRSKIKRYSEQNPVEEVKQKPEILHEEPEKTLRLSDLVKTRPKSASKQPLSDGERKEFLRSKIKERIQKKSLDVELDISKIEEVQQESQALREKLTFEPDSESIPLKSADIESKVEEVQQESDIELAENVKDGKDSYKSWLVSEILREALVIERDGKSTNNNQTQIDPNDIESKIEEVQQDPQILRKEPVIEPDKQHSDNDLHVKSLDIELDMSKIEEIKQESEVLREKLVIESDNQQSNQTTPNNDIEVLSQIETVLGDRSGTISKVLHHMMINNWRCSVDSVQFILESGFANVIIDNINDIARDEIGDVLIFEENNELVVVDEYRDEIQDILGYPKDTLPPEIVNEVDEEWLAFAEKMQAYYWDILGIILSGDDVNNRLNTLAKSHRQTENILIDEINEIAYETIDDILIETTTNPPTLIEDEIESIKKLLAYYLTKV